MNSIEKLAEALKDNAELQEKIVAEAKRLAENNEASDMKEATAKAVRNVLDIGLTEEELDEMVPQSTELSPEEMEQASGGSWLDDFAVWFCDKLPCKLGTHIWLYKCALLRNVPTTVAYGRLYCKKCGKFGGYYKGLDGDYDDISESEFNAALAGR